MPTFANGYILYILKYMAKTDKTKSLLDFAPDFRSGVAAVLTPGRKARQIREAVRSAGQNDGLRSDWQAIGNDMRLAMSEFETSMKWQRN